MIKSGNNHPNGFIYYEELVNEALSLSSTISKDSLNLSEISREAYELATDISRSHYVYFDLMDQIF